MDNGVRIPLSGGYVAIVSPEDAAAVLARTWSAVRPGKGKLVYAVTSKQINGKRVFVKLHRFLLNPPPDLVCDHINGDTLDNRRENLRAVTHKINANNLHFSEERRQRLGCQVSFLSGRQRWWARVSRHRGKPQSLGTHFTEADAKAACAAYLATGEIPKRRSPHEKPPIPHLTPKPTAAHSGGSSK